MFQREAFGYHFSSFTRNKTESSIISNCNFSIPFNSSFTLSPSYSDRIQDKQSRLPLNKIESFGVTSYLDIVMNSQKLDYLDPLSNQYKSLVQEWHHIESLNTITVEGYLSSYNDLLTTIIGGVLLYIYHSHIYE